MRCCPGRAGLIAAREDQEAGDHPGGADARQHQAPARPPPAEDTTLEVAPDCEAEPAAGAGEAGGAGAGATIGAGCEVAGVDDAMRATRSAEVDAAGAYGASAWASSLTSANRSSGFFCKHFMTHATRPSGRSGRSSPSGVGGSLKMRAAMCMTLSPTYGGRPASASKRIVPSPQMSARASTLWAASSCSGGE